MLFLFHTWVIYETLKEKAPKGDQSETEQPLSTKFAYTKLKWWQNGQERTSNKKGSCQKKDLAPETAYCFEKAQEQFKC